MQFFALIKPHGPVVLLLVGLRAHALDALELVDREDRRVFGGEGLCLLFGVGLVLSSFFGSKSSGAFV